MVVARRALRGAVRQAAGRVGGRASARSCAHFAPGEANDAGWWSRPTTCSSSPAGASAAHGWQRGAANASRSCTFLLRFHEHRSLRNRAPRSIFTNPSTSFDVSNSHAHERSELHAHESCTCAVCRIPHCMQLVESHRARIVAPPLSTIAINCNHIGNEYMVAPANHM